MGLYEALRDVKISVRHDRAGNQKTICPKCSAQRKNPRDPCLSVLIEDDHAIYNCHNCGWKGVVYANDTSERLAEKPGHKRKHRRKPSVGKRAASHW